MFVNMKTEKPAWLVSQDGEGVTFTHDGRNYHASSFEFFSTHREASADEIAAYAAPQRQAATAKAAPKDKAARRPRKAKAAPAPTVAPAVAAKPADAPPSPTVRVEPLS